VIKKHIYEWLEIERDFKHKLLLGNGASIAICKRFDYGSIYDAARNNGLIDDTNKKLFKDFETTDFEYIMRILSITNRVNKIVNIGEGLTSSYYQKLRETLRDTIHGIHPNHEKVKNILLPFAEFMMKFDTVLSLNYDLLVYWSMLEAKDKYGNWLKDCFIDSCRFKNDFSDLYSSYGAEGATLVFYPHGNLVLATGMSGDEIKLIRPGENTYLLDTIESKWEQGEYIPLIVTEGSSAQKLQAIRRSNYLHTVYDYGLESDSDTLAIYGWSLREEDEHILRALIKGKPKKIAISILIDGKDMERKCQEIEIKLIQMHSMLKREVCDILFFDARSVGNWATNQIS
jgi:hypothetical protein